MSSKKSIVDQLALAMENKGDMSTLSLTTRHTKVKELLEELEIISAQLLLMSNLLCSYCGDFRHHSYQCDDFHDPVLASYNRD